MSAEICFLLSFLGLPLPASSQVQVAVTGENQQNVAIDLNNPWYCNNPAKVTYFQYCFCKYFNQRVMQISPKIFWKQYFWLIHLISCFVWFVCFIDGQGVSTWERLSTIGPGWGKGIVAELSLNLELCIPPLFQVFSLSICNGFNKVTITSKIKRRNTAELAFNLVKRTHLLLCPLSRYSCLRPLPDNPKYCSATTSFFHLTTTNLPLQIGNNVSLRIALLSSRSCTPLVFAFWGTGLLNVDCGAHFLLKSRAPDKSCSSSTTSHPESINNFFQKTSFRPDVKSLTWWSWWYDWRATTGFRDFLKKKTIGHFFRQSEVQLQWQGQ